MKYRVNKEKGQIEFDNGNVLPLTKDQKEEIFLSPGSRELGKKEYKTKRAEYTYGTAGQLATSEFNPTTPYVANLEDYTKSFLSSFKTRKGQEDKGFLNRLSDNFIGIHRGRLKAEHELQKEHPKANFAKTLVGIPGDLAVTHGMSGKVAAPVLGFLKSEKSLLTEPGEVGKDIASDAALGYVLDKVTAGLGKFAGVRKGRKVITDLASNEAGRFKSDLAGREKALQKGVKEIEKHGALLGKDLGKHQISKESLDLEDFIVKKINTSEFAASKAAKGTEDFIRTLFHQGGNPELNSETIKDILTSVERRIASSEATEAERQILGKLKQHLGERLPGAFSDAVTHAKFAPRLLKDVITPVEKKVVQILSDPLLTEVLTPNTWSKTVNSLKNRINVVLQKSKANFGKNVSSGKVSQELAESLKLDNEVNNIIQQIEKKINPGKKAKGKTLPRNQLNESQRIRLRRIQSELQALPTKAQEQLNRSISKHMGDIGVQRTISEGAISPRMERIQGFAPPPMQPLYSEVPPPNGIMERFADSLNKLTAGSALSSARRAVHGNTLTNVGSGILGYGAHAAGLPLAKAAIIGATGVGTAKLATSPRLFKALEKTGTRIGNLGAMQAQALNTERAINDMATRLPSYQNGVLANPAERRFLSNQVENLQIDIQDKAMIQNKINRGLPLNQ